MGEANKNWFFDLFVKEAKAALKNNGCVGDDTTVVYPELTSESIEEALGYMPADLSGGTAGQYAVSDGDGGITWRTLHDVKEVAY